MSSIKGMIERALRCPNKLAFCDRDRKIMFYSLIVAATIVCIMTLLTVAYAGSYNPLDLLRYENFKFSYTGNPVYTHIISGKCYVGLSGVNGSVTTLSLPGESKLSLYPTGNITATGYGNSTWQIAGPGARNITMMPGENGHISVVVSREDDFNYNMRLNYDNRTLAPHNRTDTGNDELKIIKKGNDQYIVNATYFPGALKWFDIKCEPCWNFSITVGRDSTAGAGWGKDMDDVRSLQYYGRINVTTDDDFFLRSPVTAMSAAETNYLVMEHAEGTLDVEHIEHKCNPADNIVVRPVDRLNVSLLDGHVAAWGYADMLDFRDQDFGRPITVIMKQGNFAILTGLLSSFLTIILAKLITIIRKK